MFCQLNVLCQIDKSLFRLTRNHFHTYLRALRDNNILYTVCKGLLCFCYRIRSGCSVLLSYTTGAGSMAGMQTSVSVADSGGVTVCSRRTKTPLS